MSALGEGLGAALGHGGPDPDEEPAQSFGEILEELKTRHGGVSGLARHLGVARTTVQRWQRGAAGDTRGGIRPKPASVARVARAGREDTTPRFQTGQLTFRTHDRDGRTRHFTAEKLFGAAGVGTEISREVREIYVSTGNPEAAAAALWSRIKDPFWRGYFYDEEFEREDTARIDPNGYTYGAETVTVHV